MTHTAENQALKLGISLKKALSKIAPTYPLAPPVNAVFPQIVYSRIRLGTTGNKDALLSQAEPVFSIEVEAASYEESITLACAVLDALDGIGLPVKVEDSAEGIIPNGPEHNYLQVLTVKFEIE